MRIHRLVASIGAAALALALPTISGATTAHADINNPGPYYVHSEKGNNQVLDDRASSGTDVLTYQFHGGTNQQFYLPSTVPGIVKIIPKSAAGSCATAAAPSSPIPLHVCKQDTADNQLWQVHRLGATKVLFESVAVRGQCIAFVNVNGSAVLAPCVQEANQIWNLKPVG